MLIVPLIISLATVAVLLARGREEPVPLTPSTTVGKAAVASLALVLALLVPDDPLPVAVAVGIPMAALGVVARLRYGDRSPLVVLPIIFGAWFVAIAAFLVPWNASHED